MKTLVINENEENSLAKLEDSIRTQSKRKQIETAILGTVLLGGVLAATLIAPNVIQVLHKVIPDLRPVNQKQSIKRAIGRLIQNGYIKKEGNRYHITNEGEKRFNALLIRSKSRNISGKNEKWDKKWRIVTFDIKETEKKKRDALRSVLVETGFVKLQSSVWVYPFRCDEIVALLKFNLKLGRSAVYIIADGIEGDEWLRDHFKLPQSM